MADVDYSEYLSQLVQLAETANEYNQRVADVISSIPFFLGCLLGALMISEFFRRF